jgi:hypothetical protein
MEIRKRGLSQRMHAWFFRTDDDFMGGSVA